ncbi:MAG: AraC family transcriptional regulator, partial [Clostridiales bacterium]|nr:AraC family transcriptional regulator [Clostridiales bacterium]
PADVPPAAPPNAVVQWIEAHYAEDISLESVADQFHITPVHLSRWFKKENDVNFSTFLAALRIAHARELLDADPSIRNADLAARVGMASVLTFTRQFKSQTGMTPDQYRKGRAG